jgi:hypothetical protein
MDRCLHGSSNFYYANSVSCKEEMLEPWLFIGGPIYSNNTFCGIVVGYDFTDAVWKEDYLEYVLLEELPTLIVTRNQIDPVIKRYVGFCKTFSTFYGNISCETRRDHTTLPE